MRKQIYRYPLALFAAGLLAACSGDKNEGIDKEGVETVLPAQQNEVTVMTLKKTTFSHELVSNGKVEARQQADLSFRITSEPVAHIYVKNGDRVKRGQKLAELDLFTLRNKLEQAENSLKQAELEMQVLCGAGVQAQQVLRLDLKRTIALANDSSLSAFRYQNMYLSGYWEYRSYKAARLPSLSLNLTPAQYYRYITQRYDSQADIDVYREQQMFSAAAGLSLVQNFDLLGGTFYVDTQLDYLRNFGDVNSTQFSTVPFRIGYQQDLLGFNAFRWDRKIEPLKFEKVKKQFIYNSESVSEEAVNYFFSLAMAQADYRLAEDNLATADTLYAIGEQRQKIAAISQADLLTLKLDKVNAWNTLKNAEITRKRAMSALATFLNLDKNTYIEIDLPSRPRYVDIPADRALLLAKENNPTYLEQRQNVLEAEREVDRTKKESRFNASVNASVGFNQVADNLGAAYRNLLQQDLVSLTVSIPLVDWGVRKGKCNMARNNLNVVKIAARQEEISLEEDVMMTVSDFNVQQDLIASASEALDLAELAYDQTRWRFIIGKADISSLTLSLNRQQEAQKNYIQALQNYWLNYYKIRKLTLHDFESGMSLSDRFDFDNNRY